ncbi:hypothetical protein [Streptomonospora wellingtoniae]|uniref:ESX-1 secretion-associated protein n=1 Tax=Streptomonospora wellingtoniae TaxID=3075544 RepID=A0ABU2KUI4_9ACTN|nr:hypothetical protein [Streptomonospora sp. DSM 45055]MDT0302960.1 hypothetical protein [Streptomonospora sp. DSM 45055]
MIRTLLNLIKLWLGGLTGRTTHDATPNDLARLVATLRQACDDADTALAEADAAGWVPRRSARVLAAVGICRQTSESLVLAARAVDRRAVAMDALAKRLRDASPADFMEER